MNDTRNSNGTLRRITLFFGGLGVATVLVAAAAFGGRNGNALGAPPADDGAPSSVAPAMPSSQPVAASATPVVTSTPSAAPSDAPANEPSDGGSDAIPLTVDLANATGADVHLDIVDRTGLLVAAESGRPGDGASVEPYRLVVENIDPTTLKLTWIDFPIDNALVLFVDDGGHRLVLVQPEPQEPADAMGFDRVLILRFSEPISASQVETFLQGGLDTLG